MRQRKSRKHCDGCQQDDGARYRGLVDLFLCLGCYTAWLKTGKVPAPEVGDEVEAQRW